MILVVGDVMDDLIVRPEGAPAPGTDRRAEILRRPGGSGANIACWLGHCGVPTRFAGRVGTADRDAHHAAFARHGVDAHLAADTRRATGTVVAVLGPDGERSFLTDRGANAHLAEPDLPAALLDGVRALHVSGHAFFLPGPRDAVRRLIGRADKAGIAVSVDAGSAGWLAESGKAEFRDWTEGASLAFANADEAALLDGNWAVFVVTGGAGGAEARHAGQTVRVNARPAELRDGTGAGDAFAAGFLAARWRGADLGACLSDAAALAAFCVTRTGGRPPA